MGSNEKLLAPVSYFGEVAVLFHGGKYVQTALAHTNIEYCTLGSKELQEVFIAFPALMNGIKEAAIDAI